MPSVLTSQTHFKLFAKKRIDLKAAKIITAQNILLMALKKYLKLKSYFKENVLSRIASAIHLKAIIIIPSCIQFELFFEEQIKLFVKKKLINLASEIYRNI